MPRRKNIWQEKLLDSKGYPTVAPVTGKMSKRWGTGTMVIAAPVEVEEIMKTVRKGRMLTIDVVRQILTSKHGADFACPMTTGIFTWIAPMKPKKKAVNESRPTGARSSSAVNSIPNTLAASTTSKPVLKTKDIT